MTKPNSSLQAYLNVGNLSLCITLWIPTHQPECCLKENPFTDSHSFLFLPLSYASSSWFCITTMQNLIPSSMDCPKLHQHHHIPLDAPGKPSPWGRNSCRMHLTAGSATSFRSSRMLFWLWGYWIGLWWFLPFWITMPLPWVVVQSFALWIQRMFGCLFGIMWLRSSRVEG